VADNGVVRSGNDGQEPDGADGARQDPASEDPVGARTDHERLLIQLADAQRDLALWSARARESTTELQRVLRSRSWRLTMPLRFVSKLVRGDWIAVQASIQPPRT